MSETAELIPLPFTEYKEGDIAGRGVIRENKAIKRARELYFVPLRDIEIREGFNVREDFGDLEEFADSLDANGLATPLTVDVLSSGQIFVERGHRRLAALAILEARYRDKGDIETFNEKFDKVECIINPVSLTEEGRQIALHTSNNVKPLTPLENGRLCARLKENFGHSHEEIAKKLGMARQTVDNHIRLWALPEETKQAIRDGRVTINEALAGIREAAKEGKKAKFTTIELPPDNRDEKQSSEGKGLGQTMALQKDRALDAETQKALDEERLFASNSEEQKMIDRSVGNCDWIYNQLKAIEDKYPSLVADIAERLKWVTNDLAKVKDELIKLQKN